MAKAKKPEDEQDDKKKPEDQPGGDHGNEFIAGGKNPLGESEKQEGAEDKPETEPQRPSEDQPKPKTIVVTQEELERMQAELKAQQEPQQPSVSTNEPEAPKTFKHKSGVEIPFDDFDDEKVVWAEKFDAAQKVWDAKKFTRTAWDKATAGRARKYRAQPHSGWVRMAPPLPEWEGLEGDDDPEGGEGRVGPRPRDRNNP